MRIRCRSGRAGTSPTPRFGGTGPGRTAEVPLSKLDVPLPGTQENSFCHRPGASFVLSPMPVEHEPDLPPASDGGHADPRAGRIGPTGWRIGSAMTNVSGQASPVNRPYARMSQRTVQDGDGAGAGDFDDLFDRLYPSVHRYCHGLTGDPDEADDVAQEAFVRMMRHDVTGSSDGLRSWLFRTALNLVRDRSRIRTNRERLLQENPDHSAAPSAPMTPARATERADDVRRVRRVLETLDERDRALLLMREEGFRYREMAEAVGVAASSIGTLLARAETRFAQAYEDSLAEDDASERR